MLDGYGDRVGKPDRLHFPGCTSLLSYRGVHAPGERITCGRGGSSILAIPWGILIPLPGRNSERETKCNLQGQFSHNQWVEQRYGRNPGYTPRQCERWYQY